MTLVSVALLVVGCGFGDQRGLTPVKGDRPPPWSLSDAGSADALPEAAIEDRGDAAFGPALKGVHAFDVTARLPPAEGSTGSRQNRFTLVLDADARRIIVVGFGGGQVVPVRVTGAATFQTTAEFRINPATPTLEGVVSYASLEATVSGSSLTGRFSGAASVSCGDCVSNSPVSGVVSGTAEATAPSLRGVAPFDPFERFAFLASEPLNVTATAALVTTSGRRIELVPQVGAGAFSYVIGFIKPDVVLPFGEGYVVALDRLVDFAGHTGPADGPLRLGETPVAPLAAEDGFESADGATFGEAAVVKDAAAVIAGTRSLYVGAADAPPLGAIAAGSALVVTLAVQPGDTRIHFSARGVSRDEAVSFWGGFRLARWATLRRPPPVLPRSEGGSAQPCPVVRRST
jgi:hypothetical protein